MRGMLRPIHLRNLSLIGVLGLGVAYPAAGQAVSHVENGHHSADSLTSEHLAGATHGSHSVKLSWASSKPASALPRDKVLGYNVYRSETSHNPHPQQINSTLCTDTTYTDTDVTLGTVYFYVVRGVSTVARSEPSNEARAEIPPQ